MNLNPPRSIEAEKALLGVCIVTGVSPSIAPEDFTAEHHQVVCRAMQQLELSGVRPDFITVVDKVAELTDGRIKGSDLGPLLMDLPGEYEESDHRIEVYAESIRQHAAARRAQYRALEFVEAMNTARGDKMTDEVSRFLSDMLNATDAGDRARISGMLEGMKTFLSTLERKMSDKCYMDGIPTEFYELDRMTHGLAPGNLVVIAARPSMGKTCFAGNIALNVAKRGHRVLIYSLEMIAQSLIQRMIAREARVPLDNIRNGRFERGEYERVTQAAERLSGLNLQIIDTPVTALDIMRRARRHKPDLVMVDYLQLVTVTGKESANYAYGEISKGMKAMAQELNIPVILLSQLTRSNEKEGRRPRLSDLRDSGQIEQDSDIVIFLHADKGDHTLGWREIILAKQRQGDCGIWKSTFLRPYQAFERYTEG